MNYLYLGILALLIQQILLTAAATSFVRDKSNGALEAKRAQSRSHLLGAIAGKWLFYVLTGTLLAWLIYGAAIKIFALPVRGNWGDILIFTAMYCAALVSGGVAIGLAGSNEVYIMQRLMCLTYPTFLLSGYVRPRQFMPAVLAQAVQWLPLTYQAVNVRQIALLGKGLAELQSAFLALGGLTLAALLVAAVGWSLWPGQ